jgi:chitinase
MTQCIWRGSGGDCNGQCHEGEVKIAASSWGGIPGESSSTHKCSRGDKALCCKADSYNSLTEGCRWTEGCGGECNKDEESVAYTRDRWGGATVFCNGNHYCCKKGQPIPFRNCHWVGQGDCADNTCAKSEVTLWTDGLGDAYSTCGWWRKKALCCTPNPEAMKEDICDSGYNSCEDDPDLCGDDLEDDSEYRSLSEQGKPKPGMPRDYALKMAKYTLKWMTRSYPTGKEREYLFRRGTGLATMVIKGGYQ